MGVRYRRHPQTAWRVIEGKAFVVTAHLNQLHTLNRTATRLWELADGEGCSVDEAVARLVAEFEVDEPTARTDVERSFAEMVAKEILAPG
jgi:hypothetical protein